MPARMEVCGSKHNGMRTYGYFTLIASIHSDGKTSPEDEQTSVPVPDELLERPTRHGQQSICHRPHRWKFQQSMMQSPSLKPPISSSRCCPLVRRLLDSLLPVAPPSLHSWRTSLRRPFRLHAPTYFTMGTLHTFTLIMSDGR